MRPAPAIAPPPARSATKTRVITVKMSPDHFGMLQALEQRLSVNQSEVIRMAIERLHERMVT